MTDFDEVEGVELVNCAMCDGEIEVFIDDASFICPYCNAENYFVTDDSEPVEEVEAEKEIRYDTYIVLNRSIVQTWCSRHRATTEHAWVSDRQFGQKLACLVCWPSKRPAHPIYHIKKEE
jgi:hypothetical protein